MYFILSSIYKVWKLCVIRKGMKKYFKLFITFQLITSWPTNSINCTLYCRSTLFLKEQIINKYRNLSFRCNSIKESLAVKVFADQSGINNDYWLQLLQSIKFIIGCQSWPTRTIIQLSFRQSPASRLCEFKLDLNRK